jgi:alpha-galactosidase
MPILVNEHNLTFHLQSSTSSYILHVLPEGYLTHMYWGRRIRNASPDTCLKLLDAVLSTQHLIQRSRYR